MGLIDPSLKRKGSIQLREGWRSASERFAAVSKGNKTLSKWDVIVWGGARHRFGHLGRPSRWFNVLGNAQSPNGDSELHYALNGRPARPLILGTTVPRLIQPGDFNIELNPDDLNLGHNRLVMLNNGDVLKEVTIEYDPREHTSQPVYHYRMSATESLDDVAQIVDGQWALTPQGARCAVIGYDRLLAFGDWNWRDYEFSATLTPHAFASRDQACSGPGLGILMRWRGHHPDALLPHHEWRPIGALCWYRFGSDRGDKVRDYRLCIMGGRRKACLYNELIAEDASGRTLEMDRPYCFKSRVQSQADGPAHYAFKVWPNDEEEPEAWDLEGDGLTGEAERGSALVVLHHADATVGDCRLQRLGAIEATR